MPLEIVHGDITKMEVDAIVNTANRRPVIGRGADEAIHSAAGPMLLKARQKIGCIPRGCSAVTPGFDLPAKYVIHTVGTHWRGGYHGELAVLRSCYLTALRLAAENGCKSIAFPLLATGNFGYPREIALDIAQDVLQGFAAAHEDTRLILVRYHASAEFAQNSDGRTAASRRRAELDYDGTPNLMAYLREKYPIADNTYESLKPYILQGNASEDRAATAVEEQADLPYDTHGLSEKLKEKAKQHKETFSEALYRYMVEKDLYPPDVYKPVFMKKQTFFNIYNNKNSQPSKKTAVLIAIGLNLNLDQTLDFIGKAGYALTDSIPTDMIVSYFISHGRYNIMDLDEVLFDQGLETLGS